METSVASLTGGDDIRPYKIHVSSKYLDLTKKKLELTRLPHELLLPRSREWELGTPKSEVEPLIDFWLEQYSWRTREAYFNTSFPQFRAHISLPPPSPSPALRIHFIHMRSPHAHAIPLLLLPAFPITNLSLTPLFATLSDPPHPHTNQPFHIICPSLPGTGFTDSFTSPSETNQVVYSTAFLFHELMLRLGYEHYIVSATGSGRKSPAGIDYHLPAVIAERYGPNGENGQNGGCRGVHYIDPPLPQPALVREPWEWTKFNVAKFFHADVWGYTKRDWNALSRASYHSNSSRFRTRYRAGDLEAQVQAAATEDSPLLSPTTRPLLQRSPISSRTLSTFRTLGLQSSGNQLQSLALKTPNTLAYALCDSPVGLLSLVLTGLRSWSKSYASVLSKEQIINIAQLAWLPGPEGGMRLWCGAVAELEGGLKTKKWCSTRTGVTVFDGTSTGEDGVESGGSMDADGRESVRSEDLEDADERYICPAWSSIHHNVVCTMRQSGRSGIVALERGNCIIDGIRALAKEVVSSDTCFSPVSKPGSVTIDVVEIISPDAEVQVEEGDNYSPEDENNLDEESRGRRLETVREGDEDDTEGLDGVENRDGDETFTIRAGRSGDDSESDDGMQTDVESPDTVILAPRGPYES